MSHWIITLRIMKIKRENKSLITPKIGIILIKCLNKISPSNTTRNRNSQNLVNMISWCQMTRNKKILIEIIEMTLLSKEGKMREINNNKCLNRKLILMKNIIDLNIKTNNLKKEHWLMKIKVKIISIDNKNSNYRRLTDRVLKFMNRVLMNKILKCMKNHPTIYQLNNLDNPAKLMSNFNQIKLTSLNRGNRNNCLKVRI